MTALRVMAAFAGLAALWVGCDVASMPVDFGGPMNPLYNVVGLPLIALGVIAVAMAPVVLWIVVWPLAALVAYVATGENFWTYLPIRDGAYQSIRSGAPDPMEWPAPAFLYMLSFSPIGVAAAALSPGPKKVVALIVSSGAAAIAAGFAYESFGNALLSSDYGYRVFIIATSAIIALVTVWFVPPVGPAIAAQALLLSALCTILWFAFSPPF